MKVTNITRKNLLVENGELALTFWSRLKGLLFTDDFPKGQGILIKPCSSIHTIGMAYSIDIIFVDEQDMVIKTVVGMKPYRLTSCRGSSYVIEVPMGTVMRTATQCGDKVMVS